MKERPILFSAPMVRAILDGRKAVTRRLMKPQPPVELGHEWTCPYGNGGWHLWVKETWRTASVLDALSPAAIAAKALEAGYSGPWAPVQYEADGQRANWGPDWGAPGKVRVSIHMPRWAARLTLEVVSVRVERLHDITNADAEAEGMERLIEENGWKNYEPEPDFEAVTYHATARDSFASLWRSINGTDSWGANPWVWRIEFRKMEQMNQEQVSP